MSRHRRTVFKTTMRNFLTFWDRVVPHSEVEQDTATLQSHSTDTSLGTEICLLPLSAGDERHRKGRARYSSKTYRCPGSKIPTLVVVRTVRGRLAIVLGRGIGLGGVEGVVRVRIDAGPGGVCADLTNRRRRFHPETQQKQNKTSTGPQNRRGWVGQKKRGEKNARGGRGGGGTG